MKVFVSTLLFLFISVSGASLASAQESNQPAANNPAENKAEVPLITIDLVSGERLQVEELRETSDGIWYRRGGVTTLLDRKRVARIEGPSTEQNNAAPEDSSHWSLADAKKVENFFVTKFGRPLPTTAFGQSDIHDRWGLDHRQGLDVGLHPDSVEGIALVDYLRSEKIPYLVFRHAIPGVATGPHIHIGRPSHRYLRR